MSTTTPGGISPTRLALGAIGLGGLLWGAWLLVDDGTEALVSLAIWLAGAIIVHDAILAPLTIGLTLVAAKFLPPAARMPAVVAFIIWATCSLAFIAVLSGQAGKAGNETILGRPYALTWVAFTGLLAAAAAAAALMRARRP